MPWIGVDLDGTLARYDGWRHDGGIGEPILPMLERVWEWLAEGQDVRIFTARVAVCEEASHESGLVGTQEMADQQRELIRQWCLWNIGVELPITCVKDFNMLRLYDDRCIQVEFNTGRLMASDDTQGPPVTRPCGG